MRYYYNPKTNQYAKVLGVDDRTQIAIVVIDDKKVDLSWDEFIGKFKELVDVKETKTT